MHKILAGIEFLTNEAVTDHARSIKSKYKDGEKIFGQDDLFLREFITLHPRANEKIGCGVAYFTIQPDEHWRNSRQFVLVRIDGERAIFSHNRIRTTQESQEERHRRRVLEAMREAIVSQVVEFKNDNFLPGKTRCPLTNEIIKEPHVDHEKPQTFIALVAEWLDINSLRFEDVTVNSDTDHRTFETMADSSKLISWQRYHSIHARLRILSKEANLSLARRG
jgi:hypothetical protein